MSVHDLPNDFLSWLGGIFDSDGTFSLSSTAQSISITNTENILIKYITNYLAMANISYNLKDYQDIRPNRRYRYEIVFNDKRTFLKRIIPFLVAKQYEATLMYAYLQSRYQGTYKPLDMAEDKRLLIELSQHFKQNGRVISRISSVDFWKWLAGFIDGDGCFELRKGKYHIYHRIKIGSVDLALAAYIQKQLSIYNIYIRYYQDTHNRNRPISTIEIESYPTLVLILPNLIPYLVLKKHEAELLYFFTTLRLLHPSSSLTPDEQELINLMPIIRSNRLNKPFVSPQPIQLSLW